MVQRNQDNDLLPQTDLFLKKHQLTNDAAGGSLTRRNFLACGVIATAALTVTPLTSALVIPPPVKCNWEFLKQIATAIAR